MPASSSWRIRALLVTSALALLVGLVDWLNPIKEGLVGEYFSARQAIGGPAFTRVDTPPSTAALDAAWAAEPPQVFSATWSGSLLVMSAGTYTFATVSDDGSHVYVDGRLVVDNGGDHAAQQKTGTVALTRGVHALFVDYAQHGGDFHLDLQWGRGGAPLAPLPAWRLATRRASVTAFVVSAGLWIAANVLTWLWFAALAAALSGPLGRWLRRFRQTLREEHVWPALKWILLGSMALNLAGIWWGLPAEWAAIELTPREVFQGVQVRFAHGWSGLYPPFHFALLSLPMGVVGAFARLGAFGGDRAIEDSATVLSFRLVSTVMAIGIVVGACRVGTRAFGPRAGVLGAAVFALLAPFLYYAKTSNADVPYLFWFVVSMVFYLRVLDRLALRDFVCFAAAATASVCTKDQAYGLFVLMPLPILLQLWRANRLAGLTRPLWRAVVDRRLAAAALTAVLVFVALHNLLFNLDGFRLHVKFITGPASVTYQDFESSLSGRVGLLRLAADLVRRSFGWPATAAAVAGLLLAVRDRRLWRVSCWLLVPAVSYYLCFIDVVLYTYDRFVMPICFVLALFTGLALDVFLGSRAGRPRSWRVAVVAGFFAYTVLYSAAVDVLMIRDSRYDVQRWLASKVRNGDLVGSIFDREYLPDLSPYRQATIATTEELQASEPRFYVLNADYARAVPPDSRPGTLLAHLADGSLGYRLAYRARTAAPWPWLIGEHPDLVGPRLEVGVYGILRNINPTIEVFERDR